MSKMNGILTYAAMPVGGKRVRGGYSIASAIRGVIAFFQRQKERDIEIFIRDRGGAFSDGIERAIDQKFWRGRNFS